MAARLRGHPCMHLCRLKAGNHKSVDGQPRMCTVFIRSLSVKKTSRGFDAYDAMGVPCHPRTLLLVCMFFWEGGFFYSSRAQSPGQRVFRRRRQIARDSCAPPDWSSCLASEELLAESAATATCVHLSVCMCECVW